ncbi:bifunctional MaoC family dehydratase N-terminal/OB-fold nucleic acid binding domain-containing protein [Allorhizocola rhizosphaerae]|uniref:bifunctional MaoC family dehydratase N-terminal/OB-fold nucleic acid binding domain-containing protein n=1 Tax=Allorhizocola rhizosphaerae TaxID=1872709 RepID=UPI001FE619B3|nr:bifunctional MaoC family dehydratase N-terminal/OB-fold nucleic acid binding domain-containing protein [Allorhizocola rhizosphaerae]
MSRILEETDRLKALGWCGERVARDPVNQPMINNWVEAMGDTHPAYREGLAPPAMVQVWTMRGLHPAPQPDDPLHAMSAVLDEAGFTSVVATNCEQTYHRALKVGELLTVRSRLSDVVGPKKTSLGVGWFVTTESTWFSGEEPVATMLFRILKYQPRPQAAAASPITPVVSRDTAFFWEGTAAGQLRIQRCEACGRLRHPPGPMCPACGATSMGFVVSEGAGTVYSYVVHHHPPVPGKRLPFVVALVELPEGVRVLGEFLGESVEIGRPVRCTFVRVGGFHLPAWEAAA